jgi:hypothetical protein
MLSVRVRWMGLFTNERRIFSRFAEAFTSSLLAIKPKTFILSPLRVMDELLAEKSGQMPALISFHHEGRGFQEFPQKYFRDKGHFRILTKANWRLNRG